MSDWLFWSVLAAMLFGGRLARVGLYLGHFAAAAGCSALLALLLPAAPETQLHVFLFASACLLLAARRHRKRRTGATA